MISVHKAVLARLRAAVAGLDPVPAVYDDVPQNAAMPFVEIGRHIVATQNLLTDPQDLHQVTVAVWSARRGHRELIAILEAIRTSFDNADLTLETGAAFGCRVPRVESNLNTDGDQVVYVGTLTIELNIDREI